MLGRGQLTGGSVGEGAADRWQCWKGQLTGGSVGEGAPDRRQCWGGGS